MDVKTLKKYFNYKFNMIIKTIDISINNKLNSLNKNIYNLDLKVNNLISDSTLR